MYKRTYIFDDNKLTTELQCKRNRKIVQWKWVKFSVAKN